MTNEPECKNRQEELFLCLMAYRLDRTMGADEYVRVVQEITDEMKSIAKAELLNKIEEEVKEATCEEWFDGMTIPTSVIYAVTMKEILSKYKTL